MLKKTVPTTRIFGTERKAVSSALDKGSKLQFKPQAKELWALHYHLPFLVLTFCFWLELGLGLGFAGFRVKVRVRVRS